MGGGEDSKSKVLEFEIISENALENKGKLAIFRVIFRFSGYFNLWRISPKNNLKDS